LSFWGLKPTTLSTEVSRINSFDGADGSVVVFPYATNRSATNNEKTKRVHHGRLLPRYSKNKPTTIRKQCAFPMKQVHLIQILLLTFLMLGEHTNYP
jgi:hypothetical protein